MASHYVADLKRALPNGPYVLAGFCFGAVVALEMARQLPPGEVAHLAMFDVSPAEFPALFSRETLRRYRASLRNSRIARHQAELSALPGVRKAAYLGRALFRAARRAAGSLVRKSVRAFPGLARHLGPDPESAHTSAFRSYVALPFRGEATLFLSRESVPFYADDPALLWRAIASGKVTVEFIYGENGEMMKDSGAALIAEKLSEHCLVSSQQNK